MFNKKNPNPILYITTEKEIRDIYLNNPKVYDYEWFKHQMMSKKNMLLNLIPDSKEIILQDKTYLNPKKTKNIQEAYQFVGKIKPLINGFTDLQYWNITYDNLIQYEKEINENIENYLKIRKTANQHQILTGKIGTKDLKNHKNKLTIQQSQKAEEIKESYEMIRTQIFETEQNKTYVASIKNFNKEPIFSKARTINSFYDKIIEYLTKNNKKEVTFYLFSSSIGSYF